MVLLLHFAATWALVGLIWFVQVVHYPLLAYVGEHEFLTYEHLHTRRTGWVVGPLMPLEGATGTLLVINPADGVDQWLSVTGLLLVAVLWVVTWLVQVPLHRSLSQRHNAILLRKLVRTNWIRTALWTVRGGLVLGIAFQWLI